MPNTRRNVYNSRLVSGESSDKPESLKRLGSGSEEAVQEDDLCSICNLLLVRPMKTTCNHTFCEDCFTTWADMSLSIHTIEVGLDVDQDLTFPLQQVKANCPMCRTLSIGRTDHDRAASLEISYPLTYAARMSEASPSREDDHGNLIEPVEIMIGNEHRLCRSATDGTRNVHSWHFFVKTSRTDIIEEIHIHLHPTFSQNRIVLTHAPYSIRRLGWGIFPIHAAVVLKAGYSWISSDAEDTTDGAPAGRLPLDWTLDFNGRGSQGRLRLRVKKQKYGQEEEDKKLSERTRQAWVRQRDYDPDYVPLDDD